MKNNLKNNLAHTPISKIKVGSRVQSTLTMNKGTIVAISGPDREDRVIHIRWDNGKRSDVWHCWCGNIIAIDEDPRQIGIKVVATGKDAALVICEGSFVFLLRSPYDKLEMLRGIPGEMEGMIEEFGLEMVPGPALDNWEELTEYLGGKE